MGFSTGQIFLTALAGHYTRSMPVFVTDGKKFADLSQ